ncbi:ABC transporter permease [Ensifer sp. YR511]|uniref:ABC transporter permease n=1 Tax=Ensifer sp. YR511 TaxID=1855294 RepID=UPI0008908E79|nr:ABC transporter permease subunit [Ensifer sp. YR511]SDN78672.1 octopine/nopaline transport system permease protein [Ensifer sp. YR511]
MAGFVFQFIGAFGVTVGLALISGVIGTAIGLVAAVVKVTDRRRFGSIVSAYTTIVRGVPELLVILLIYFGGTSLVSALAGRYVEVNAFTAGVVALSVVFGGYATEVFRGAIVAVPVGQTEAAKSLGLSAWQRWMFVVAPQMMRMALPAYGNLWISLFKDTALVSVVGLSDIMRIAFLGAGSLRAPLTFYLAASALYLSLTTFTLLSLRVAEDRYPAFGR